MRKTASILLLFILALQLGGLLFVFNIQQCIAKYQMREKLESDTVLFEKLNLTAIEYKKCLIKSNEILFKGKMFDIKSVTLVGDSVKLLVINDIKEEQILLKIKDLSDNMSFPDRELPVQLKILSSLNYISPETEFTFLHPFFQILFQSQLAPEFVSNNPDILTPPPKLV